MLSARTALITAALCLTAGAAFALPPLTPHGNGPREVTWPAVLPVGFNPATDMHQHWNADPLPGVAGKFKTYAAWDNNNWRYNTAGDAEQLKANGDAADYGHGYMETPAMYGWNQPPLGLDTPERRPVPLAAPGLVVNAVGRWTSSVNQTGMLNSNGVPVKTQINFNSLGAAVGGFAAADIEIRFADKYPTGANNAGGGADLPFPNYPEIDRSGTWPGNPQGGGTSDGVLAFWTPSLKRLTFNAQVPWFFGINANPLVAPNQFDFLSVALHEWGHVLGLDHPNGAIVNTTMFPFMPDRGTLGAGLALVMNVDADSVTGGRALYTIPTPSVGAVVGAGLLAAARRRRPA